MGQVIDADSEQPIAGALVRLAMRQLTAPPPQGATPAAGRAGQPNPPLVQLTDSEGRFLFHDLPSGAAQLSATAANYLAPNPTGRGAAAPRPVTLGEGERLLDYKIRLARLTVITGTVFDEAGEPAVGVPVRAFRRNPGGSPTPGEMRADTTDDRGVYRISGLQPADYVVAVPQTQVTAPAALGESFIADMMSGGLGGVMGDMIASGGAEAMGAMGGVRVGDLVWTSGGMGMSGPPPSANGKLFAYQTIFYPAATARAQASVITLKSGEERGGVDFQLRLVPTSRITGSVTGPDGPVKSVTVNLLPAAGAESGEDSINVATATTGLDGSFTMLGVPPGQYIAKVLKQPTPDFGAMMAANPEMAEAMGPLAGMAGMMGRGSKELLHAQVPLGVGDTDVTGVAIVLAPGAKVSGKIEFEGNAAKPTTQQWAQMSVTLTPLLGPGRSPGRAAIDAPTPDGQFKTSGYTPGRYSLVVGGPIGPHMIKSITVGGRDVTDDVFELKGTDITDAVVTYTDQISTIAGTVKAPPTGSITSVSVMIFPARYASLATWSSGLSRPLTAVQQTGAWNAGRRTPGDYLIVAADESAFAGTQDLAFFDRLARVATRVSLGVGEKKTVDLDVVKVVR
jgi:hypothetical protein